MTTSGPGDSPWSALASDARVTSVTAAASVPGVPSASGPAPLLPRYRRPLSFGAILDETFRIFRRAWRPLMLALACAAVPVGLITALWSAALGGSLFQYMDAVNSASGADDFGPIAGLYGGALGIGVLSALFLVPAYAAVVFLTDAELRGRSLPVSDALKRGLRVTPSLLLAGLLTLVLGALLLIGSTVALILWVVPGLLGLTPLIGTLVWWGNPAARQPWLCWLIILTTPFGLAMYFGYRWTLALPAIALEGSGPAEAIGRSQTLTRGHWFRLFGSFTVLGIISSVLQAVPSWIVAAIVGGVSLFVAFTQGGGAEAIADDPTGFMSSIYTVTNVASAAAQALGLTLVGALPPIALTLLFQDLRNRHEGADLSERLDAVALVDAALAAPPAPSTTP